MAPDQLERFREAVDDDCTGRQVQGIVDALVAKRVEIGAHGELKSAPRGYAKDHPRIEPSPPQSLGCEQRVASGAMAAHERGQAARRGRVAACGPMNEWLDHHVGPSQLPPDEREVR
jgi:hypothetical protein